jgi:hypothetical protein
MRDLPSQAKGGWRNHWKVAGPGGFLTTSTNPAAFRKHHRRHHRLVFAIGGSSGVWALTANRRTLASATLSGRPAASASLAASALK